MANTTNYNWETPDDTDLVKDGAAAIRTLGSSIDTTTKNLNPETTTGDIAYRSATANTNTRLAIGSSGQVLTVAGGVPSWATPSTGDIEGVTAGTGISGGGTSGTVTVTNSMATAIDAKGDLIAGTGADTFARLAVGTNGQALVADSSTSTGLKWASPASGSFTKITAGSFTGVTGVNIDSIFSSTYKNYFVLVYDFGSSGNAGNTFSLQYRYSGTTDSSSLYYGSNYNIERTNATQTAGYQATSSANLMPDIGGGGSLIGLYFSRVGNASESPKFYGNYFSSSNQDVGMSAGSLEASQTYTGIRLSCATNIAGSYTVYGLEN